MGFNKNKIKSFLFAFAGFLLLVWGYKLFAHSVFDKLFLSLVFSSALTTMTYFIWKKKIPVAISLNKFQEKRRRHLLKFLSKRGFYPELKIFEHEEALAFSTQIFEKKALVFVSSTMFNQWSLGSLQGVLLHEQYHLQEQDSLKRLVRTFVALFSVFITYFFFEKALLWAFVLFGVIELIYNRRQEYKADEFAYSLAPREIVNGLLSLQYEAVSKKTSKLRPLSFNPKVIVDYFYNLIMVNFLYSLYLAYMDTFSVHPPVKVRLKMLLKKDITTMVRQSEISKKTKGKKDFFLF